MASAVKMSGAHLSRFQGCLVGAVVGDCLGAPFETFDVIKKSDLNLYFTKSLGTPN